MPRTSWDRISEDVFAGSDFEFAMRRVLSSGWRNPGGQRLAGIEELVEMVRRRRLEQLNRYNLESVFDDIRERLDGILSQERKTIRERLDTVEEGSAKNILEKIAQPKLDKLDDLSPEPGSALKELQDYEWMDSGAEQKYRELMDELQRQVADTYFQNLDQGLRSMTGENMERVKDMLHDLNQMLRERERRQGARFRGLHGQAWRPLRRSQAQEPRRAGGPDVAADGEDGVDAAVVVTGAAPAVAGHHRADHERRGPAGRAGGARPAPGLPHAAPPSWQPLLVLR